MSSSPFRRSFSLGALVLLLLLLGGLSRLRRSATPPPGPTDGCTAGEASCAPDQGEEVGSPGPSTIAADRVCPDAGYLCAGIDGGPVPVRRWTGAPRTVVVHVPEPAHEDPAVALALQRAAAAGIRAWNGQPFPILVDERGTREADLRVEWAPALGGTELGRAETRWTPSDGLRVTRLVLVTRSPFRPDRPVEADQVRLTAAHEMGHALGLPHSDSPRDVMYPTNTASALTARDYRTLEALYELEDGLLITP